MVMSKDPRSTSYQGGRGGGGRQTGNCYKCGMRGHWARNCYAGRRGGRGGRY